MSCDKIANGKDLQMTKRLKRTRGQRADVTGVIVSYLRKAGSIGAVLNDDMAKSFGFTSSAMYYSKNKLLKGGVIIGSCAENSHHQTFAIADQYKDGDEWRIAANCHGKGRIKVDKTASLSTTKEVAVEEIHQEIPKTAREIYAVSMEIKKLSVELVEENLNLTQRLQERDEDYRKVLELLENIRVILQKR